MSNSSTHEYQRATSHPTATRPCSRRQLGSLLSSMAPKRGRPTGSAKSKAPMQQQLEQLPLIKKPLELIGEYINVPGAFWQGQGRMSTVEKKTLYKCVVG